MVTEMRAVREAGKRRRQNNRRTQWVLGEEETVGDESLTVTGKGWEGQWSGQL